MNIFLDEQSYTTCNKFPMIPADSDEIIHQEYLNHDIPWLSSSNYFKKILIQTRQPGNHPGPFCHPNLQQQHAGEVDEFQGLGPGGSTIHFKRAPKRWFLGKLSGEKKRRHIEDGVSMGKWSVCFFRSNECFKKFIAVSWSCLNPFIFVPKSLMVVYSIHSISEAKIIINFQIKLSPHWVWMAFFYSMALCVLLLVTLHLISSSTSQMAASLLLAWNCGCSRKIRVRTCENSCSRKDHMGFP